MINDIENFPPINVSLPNHCQKIKDDIVHFYFNLSRKCGDQELRKMSTQLGLILFEIKLHIKNHSNNSSPDSGSPFLFYVNLLFNLIAHTRDISFGKGEQQLTYMMLHTWYSHYPILAVFALKTIVSSENNSSGELSYGSWKDIPRFCDYVRRNSDQGDNHPFIETAVEMMNRQLLTDSLAVCDSADGRTHISNVAKWIPREKSQFHWVFEKLVIQWAQTHFPHYLNSANNDEQYYRAFNKCKSIYRKMRSATCQKLDLIESKQCSNKWGEINPFDINARTLSKQQNAFLNQTCHCEPRFYENSNTMKEFDRVQSANYMNCFFETQLTRSCSYPYSYAMDSTTVPISYYVRQAIELNDLLKNCANGSQDSNDQKNQNISNKIHRLNEKWIRLSQKCKPLSAFIPIVDISREVNDESLYQAIGFGAMIAEHSSLGKRLITVDHKPSWINFESCDGFTPAIQTILGSTPKIYTNQNILSAFALILESIIATNTPPDIVEKMVAVVLSNSFSYSLHSEIEKMFTLAGFISPNIVYWNMSSKYIENDSNYPCSVSDSRKTFISGYSISAFHILYKVGRKHVPTDFQILRDIVYHPRYARMSECIRCLYQTV